MDGKRIEKKKQITSYSSQRCVILPYLLILNIDAILSELPEFIIAGVNLDNIRYLHRQDSKGKQEERTKQKQTEL